MSRKEQIYNELVEAIETVKKYAKKYPRYGINYTVTDEDFDEYAGLLMETVAYDLDLTD